MAKKRRMEESEDEQSEPGHSEPEQSGEEEEPTYIVGESVFPAAP